MPDLSNLGHDRSTHDILMRAAAAAYQPASVVLLGAMATGEPLDSALGYSVAIGAGSGLLSFGQRIAQRYLDD